MATAFRLPPLAKPDIIGILLLREAVFSVKVMMCSDGEDEGNPALTTTTPLLLTHPPPITVTSTPYRGAHGGGGGEEP